MFSMKGVHRALAAGVLATMLANPVTALAVPANESITSGNPNYNLGTAVYTLYDKETGGSVVKDVKNNNVVFTMTYANGAASATSKTYEIPVGDYWIEETTAAMGFKKDPNMDSSQNGRTKVTITADHTESVPLKAQSTDEPYTFTPPVWQKRRKGSTTVEGEANLAGCVVRVDYYAVTSLSEAQSASPTRTWYFETDSTGKVDMATASPITFRGAASSGFDTYGSSNGSARRWLLGFYKFTEVQAPTGFVLEDNTTWQACTLESVTNTVKNTPGAAQAMNDFVAVYSNDDATNDRTFTNTEIFGGIYLEKVDVDIFHGIAENEAEWIYNGQGDGELVGAVFDIYYDASNAGSPATMTYNGQSYSGYGTSGAKPLVTITTKLETGDDGVERVIARTASNTTLPYGHYIIKERTAPEGYNLTNKTMSVFIDGLNGTSTDRDKAQTGLWYRTGYTGDVWVDTLG